VSGELEGWLGSARVALSPGDSGLFNPALTGAADSIYARRVALASPAPPRPLLGDDLGGSHIIVPAPDGDQVAIATFGSDSLVIHRLSTGANTKVTTGIPLSFSPISAALLVMDRGGDLNDARIVTIPGGASAPANLALPDTTRQFALRWDVNGIEVLWLSEDRQELLYRRGDGTIVSAYASADTLRFPIVWSPDGRFAALWSSRIEGTGADKVRKHELWSVDLALLSGRRIAYANGPAGGSAMPPARGRGVGAARLAAAFDVTGGLAYSADGSQLGYIFKSRVYRSPNPLPTTRPFTARRMDGVRR
jgi:hypothetical protein